MIRLPLSLAGVILFVAVSSSALAQKADPNAPPAGSPAAQVAAIRVQPDKAPDCSSLKAIVQSVTAEAKTNDQKAIAIYNFMLLTHFHCPYAVEDGGIPALKEINVYGYGVCGGTHAVQSALWRELGWQWRFIGWPGHTTVEAQYDGKWHYFDAFLKFYAWMPDGKGGSTVAGEYDLLADKKQLIDDAFVFDDKRSCTYMKYDQFVMVDGKPNWRAHEFLSCGDSMASGIPKQLNKAGPSEDWAGYKHATGLYSTNVNLSPGFCMTNTWDSVPDAWYWKGSKVPPAHSCPNNKDTRNNPGYGLVLEPYIDSRPARTYANGTLVFAPDLAGQAALKSFLKTENVKVAGKALVPAEAGKPAIVVVQLAGPYVLTLGKGEAQGAETVEVSVDDGRTFQKADLANFSQAIKGKLSAQVKIGFSTALKGLRIEATFENNVGALPFLSPGRNKVAVAVADAKALGENKLVVTYAYRLGSRGLNFEQLCTQGKRIANQSGAKWDSDVTYAQKTFTAKDLPATFEIDCPTPKGQTPVYPRMVFVRREVLAPGAAPQPLPAGAVEAKPAAAEELQELPNPLTIGFQPPPPTAASAPAKAAKAE